VAVKRDSREERVAARDSDVGRRCESREGAGDIVEGGDGGNLRGTRRRAWGASAAVGGEARPPGRSRSCRGRRDCTMKRRIRVAGADPVLREGSARCCDASVPPPPLFFRGGGQEEFLLESERDKRGRRNRPSPTKFRRTKAAETSRTPLHCLFNLVLGGERRKPGFCFCHVCWVFLHSLLSLILSLARQLTERNFTKAFPFPSYSTVLP
jgi:hypothetical protein